MTTRTFELLGAGPVSAALISFFIVALAEIGDKSQLACVSLATRHRGWPIFIGVSLAFGTLNLLAVLFGAVVAAWLPMHWVALIVFLLFAGFGLHALLSRAASEEEIAAGSGRNLLLSSFLLIFVAEFGDKTQIAVAALSTAAHSAAVWLGATLGMMAMAGIGIVAGRTLLQRVPATLLQRLSGVLFLLLAVATLIPLITET